MANGEINATDLTEETTSTLSGNEQFVMFDPVEGKRADIDAVATYIAGDKTQLQTTDKNSLVGAINEVNGKAADLKEDLSVLDYYKYDDNNLTISGYLSLSTGAVQTDATGFHCSYPIPIPRGASKITVTKSGNISGGAVVAFYTGYKHSATTFISGVNMPSESNLPMKVSIPSTAKYVAFCGRTANPFEAVIDSSKICNDVYSGVNGFDFGLQAGSIGADGTITYGSTSISNYISKLLYKNTFKSIKVAPKDGYLCNIAYFNNGAFVSRGSSWIGSGSILEVDTTYDCIVMLALEATGTKTAEQMLAGYDIQVITSDELQTVYNNLMKYNSQSKTLFKENAISSIACGKVIHYSIDDCYLALRRLITENYTSIFDNYIFALLKDVHETTGAVFTMNVINEISDFDIANVPDTFASEFQSNKEWLKFAWHGSWSTVTYSGFSTAYTKFVNNVYRFTGTYDCIDRITRTESFYGTKSAVQALKDNTNAPIIGLLTADDTRISYYLDSNQNLIAINKGKYFDFENEMVFIRSASRLDNVTGAQLIAEIEGNPCYQNFVEVWLHEGLIGESIRQTLKDIGNWASENGYNNYYPSKIFK